MKQELNLEIQGIKTFYSPQLVDQGAMEDAVNVNVEEVGRIESRRGFKEHVPALADSINSMVSFKDTLMAQHGTKLSYLNETGTPVWTEVVASGYVVPNSAVKIKYAFQSGNMYYTSNNGIYKTDNPDATPRLAGIPQGLGGTAELSAAGSGWFSNNEQVAYRIVWGYRDANNNLILGAPSERFVVVNSSGVADTVTLDFYIPTGITTDDFYQIYRSGLSGGLTIDPNDILGLVYEANPTNTDISNGEITGIVDITSDALRGATLYTSTEGIASANYEPPLAVDITSYKNSMLFSNTKTKHRIFVTLLAVDTLGGGSGIEAGDIVTINSVAYTGVAYPAVPGVNEFVVGGGATPSENIDLTARSLIRTVNGSASNTTIDGYYLSGYNDLPGRMLFSRTDLSDTAFTFDINDNENAFNPSLVSGPITSSNEEKQQRVYFSKVQQPEAVPLLNYIDVGSENFPILRMIALRDSVFFFKTDGIYRLSGEDPSSFNVFKFDNTVVISAPESAVVFNNQIYLMTNQGVVSVNDSGVLIQSRDIENLLRPYQNPALYPTFATTTFGISYESDRKYILFSVLNEGDTTPTNAFVYNTLSNQWTRWSVNCTAGAIRNSEDKLYLGKTDKSTLIERKDLTFFDYADAEIDVTIVSYDSDTDVVILTSTADVVEGWSLRQNNSKAIISEILPNYTAVPYTSYSDGTLASVPPGATQFVLDYEILTASAPTSTITNFEWFDPGSAFGFWNNPTWLLDGPGVGGGVFFLANSGSYFNAGETTITVDLGNGGSFELAYKKTAYEYAYLLGNNWFFIDQNGAIYANTTDTGVYDYAHLVLTPDFLTGPLGSATPTSFPVNAIRLSQNGSFSAGAATINEPIPVEVTLIPQYAGNTGKQKHWQEIIYFFNELRSSSVTAGFRSDYSSNTSNVELSVNDTIPWGSFTWGDLPWGGDLGGSKRVRTFFPREKQRSFQASLIVSTNEAFAKFSLNGVSIIFSPMEARQR